MLNYSKMQIAIKSEKHYNKVVKVISKLGYTEHCLTAKPSDVMWLKLYKNGTYSDFTHLNLVFPYPEVTLKQLKQLLKERKEASNEN